MATKAERLAIEIERGLAALCQDMTHYFDEQLENGRPPSVLAHSAEAGVTFKVRGARWRQGRTPDGYVVLREERTIDAPNYPRLYWYGLVHRLPSGEERYEGFHCHFEPGESTVDHHFQIDVDDVTVYREAAPPVHAVSAIDRLMDRYYQRLDELEDEDG